ncbi:MAG: GH3 auxin-responsive promoter, partial [Fulvivirga sp.]|nr:GH3 auxin-responsive promoter [Fulvivirga sp.]
MPLLGTLLKKGIRIRESLDQEFSNPFELQKQELKKLMITSANTKFGDHYKFKEILKSFKANDYKA